MGRRVLDAGERMISSQRIREVLEGAPTPPGESLPAGVSDEELVGFTQRTRIEMPDGLRDFLKITNGPCVAPGGLNGIRPVPRTELDIETRFQSYPDWLDRKWIPIAGDGCGNHYIIPTQREYGDGYPVLFVDVGDSLDSPSYIVASDIWHFVVFLLEDEMCSTGWPFNKEFMLREDPDILHYVGVPLPWQT